MDELKEEHARQEAEEAALVNEEEYAGNVQVRLWCTFMVR